MKKMNMNYNNENNNIINYKINNKMDNNNKINYKFEKDPNNLKYKHDITNTNCYYGINDIYLKYLYLIKIIKNILYLLILIIIQIYLHYQIIKK